MKDILNKDHFINLSFLKTRYNLSCLTNVCLALNIPHGKGNLP